MDKNRPKAPSGDSRAESEREERPATGAEQTPTTPEPAQRTGDTGKKGEEE